MLCLRNGLVGAIILVMLCFTADINYYMHKINKQLSDLFAYTKALGEIVETINPTSVDFNKLKEANVYILNLAKNVLGSGTVIKIKDTPYILSCAHLTGRINNLRLNGTNGSVKLTLIKVDPKHDLALFGFNVVPKNIQYVELGELPIIGDQVYAVGNTSGYEDVISSGIISTIEDGEYYVTNVVYFGNSGGGLYSKKGKLIGVVNGLAYLDNRAPYTMGAVVGLSTIKAFLKDLYGK